LAGFQSQINDLRENLSYPSPCPLCPPIFTQGHPMSPKAGAPNTRGFRVVGWKAERIGRGSQSFLRSRGANSPRLTFRLNAERRLLNAKFSKITNHQPLRANVAYLIFASESIAKKDMSQPDLSVMLSEAPQISTYYPCTMARSRSIPSMLAA
jgi:hypothetical protein